MGELSSLSGASPPGTINRTWLSRRFKPPPPPLPSALPIRASPTTPSQTLLFSIVQHNTGEHREGGREERVEKMSRVMKSTALLFICFLTSLSLFEFFPPASFTALSRKNVLPTAPLSLPLKNQLRETILGATRSEPTN